MEHDLYSQKGLLVLIDFLNEVIDISGQRTQLINKAREKVISTYEAAKEYLSIDDINEKLKMSNQKLFHLKVAGKCSISVSKACMKLCPTQLSITEQNQIRDYLKDPNYQNLPVNHLWAEAQRNGLFISRNTFYKYVRQIKGRTIPNDIVEEVQKKTVTATRVLEILHMDSTTFRCQNGERVYVHFIMDNYSRNILGAIPSYSSKSLTVASNLKKVVEDFNLVDTPFELYCDDGPENQGYVNEIIKGGFARITKVVANYNTRKSNNMIEAWNKKFKQVILKKFKVKSFENLKENLPEMLQYFNNLRLPVLKTLSPNEVIGGLKYEDLKIKNKMDEAKLYRLQQNRQLNCSLTSMLENINFVCFPSMQFPNFQVGRT